MSDVEGPGVKGDGEDVDGGDGDGGPQDEFHQAAAQATTYCSHAWEYSGLRVKGTSAGIRIGSGGLMALIR